MIPIQTVLALLAVLMMVGCSQKPPPGTVLTSSESQATATNAGINKLPNNLNPNIKPVPTVKNDTSVSLESNGALEWTLTLSKEEGQKLYEAAALQDEEGIKHGFNYSCSKSDEKTFQCQFKIQASTGLIAILKDFKDLKKAAATFTPEKQYVGQYALTIQPADKNYGWIILRGESTAKQMYEAMTVAPKSIAAGTFEKNEYSEGSRKAGSNVQCDERTLKSNSATKHYWCTLYLVPSTGTVDLIQQN